MSRAFDPLASARKLRESGAEESLANATVEVVQDATSELVTRDVLRAEIAGLRGELYRALWIQGGVIITVIAALLAIAEAVGR